MSSENIERQLAKTTSWVERFAPEQWSIYKSVIAEARKQNVQFAIGGGLATMTYAGQWRDTKDIDIYVMERDRERMIRVVTEAGLRDYYEQKPYDRKWIYRSYQDEIIVDIIWSMANGRAPVDEGWLQGPEAETGGERFRLLRPEEAVWSKLYIVQRDRCDWPDSLSLLYTIGAELDWHLLLDRTGDDRLLLRGLLSIFRWLCPDGAQRLPAWIWEELEAGDSQEENCEQVARRRAPLLDSRPWFTPTLEEKDAGQR